LLDSGYPAARLEHKRTPLYSIRSCTFASSNPHLISHGEALEVFGGLSKASALKRVYISYFVSRLLAVLVAIYHYLLYLSKKHCKKNHSIYYLSLAILILVLLPPSTRSSSRLKAPRPSRLCISHVNCATFLVDLHSSLGPSEQGPRQPQPTSRSEISALASTSASHVPT
jgi:hypothetical protein